MQSIAPYMYPMAIALFGLLWIVVYMVLNIIFKEFNQRHTSEETNKVYSVYKKEQKSCHAGVVNSVNNECLSTNDDAPASNSKYAFVNWINTYYRRDLKTNQNGTSSILTAAASIGDKSGFDINMPPGSEDSMMDDANTTPGVSQGNGKYLLFH